MESKVLELFQQILVSQDGEDPLICNEGESLWAMAREQPRKTRPSAVSAEHKGRILGAQSLGGGSKTRS